MEAFIIACFDVYYCKDYAKASAIVFRKDGGKIISQYTAKIMNRDIGDYISGQFYQRELPCILKALKNLPWAKYQSTIYKCHRN